ncbi:MAG: HD domain-containing protein [Burkholderiales bacterium]|nr:HD domain-containing protein [Burkholderiales bacterium]
MSQSRVRHSDIELGKPLPWDVYDEKGTLLLRIGYVINSESQVDKLVAIGVFADSTALRATRLLQYEAEEQEDTPASAAQGWTDLRKQMEQLYAGLDASIADRALANQVAEIAQRVDALCTARPDLALAIISLRQEGRYSTRHMLDTATVVRLAARAMKLPQAREQSLVCAALTMNLGTTDFQDEIKKFTGTLSKAQVDQLHEHPSEAAKKLKAAGVTDAAWLRAVQDHHEHLDGSGYPRELAGSDLHADAQIIRLADIYTARITFREYSSAVALTIALRDILQEGGKTVEAPLAGQFIRAVGIFPPGLQLRLANGEKGVVVRAGSSPNHPIVISLVAADGAPLTPGVYRDTQIAEYAVKETIDPTTFNAYIDIDAIWGV